MFASFRFSFGKSSPTNTQLSIYEHVVRNAKKIMRTNLIILLTVLISSCSGTKNVAELSKLSELTVENKSLNGLIVDRKPDYGISGRDGCVVMGEISMDIIELNKGKSIRGKVFDAENKNSMIKAGLILSMNQNGLTKSIEILSDENGIFQTDFNGKLEKIIVAYVAYRTLKIDFDRQ